MKLHESIIKIRVALQEKDMKKSGKNKFAGFTYYELSDFLPELNKLMLENGVNDRFYIKDGYSYLELIKGEERDSYSIPFTVYETPVNKNGIKSMQDIQYLGALNTYYKRYLYLNAFGITDGEIVDAIDNNNTAKNGTKPTQYKPETVNPMNVSPSQVKLIQTRISKLGIDPDTVSMLKSHYNIESWNDLPARSIQGLLEWFDKREMKPGS